MRPLVNAAVQAYLFAGVTGRSRFGRQCSTPVPGAVPGFWEVNRVSAMSGQGRAFADTRDMWEEDYEPNASAASRWSGWNI